MLHDKLVFIYLTPCNATPMLPIYLLCPLHNPACWFSAFTKKPAYSFSVPTIKMHSIATLVPLHWGFILCILFYAFYSMHSIATLVPLHWGFILLVMGGSAHLFSKGPTISLQRNMSLAHWMQEKMEDVPKYQRRRFWRDIRTEVALQLAFWP